MSARASESHFFRSLLWYTLRQADQKREALGVEPHGLFGVGRWRVARLSGLLVVMTCLVLGVGGSVLGAEAARRFAHVDAGDAVAVPSDLTMVIKYYEGIPDHAGGEGRHRPEAFATGQSREALQRFGGILHNRVGAPVLSGAPLRRWGGPVQERHGPADGCLPAKR